MMMPMVRWCSKSEAKEEVDDDDDDDNCNVEKISQIPAQNYISKGGVQRVKLRRRLIIMLTIVMWNKYIEFQLKIISHV